MEDAEREEQIGLERRSRRRRRRMLGSVQQSLTIAGSLLFVQYCVETLLLAGCDITQQTLPLTHCHYRNHGGVCPLGLIRLSSKHHSPHVHVPDPSTKWETERIQSHLHNSNNTVACSLRIERPLNLSGVEKKHTRNKTSMWRKKHKSDTVML